MPDAPIDLTVDLPSGSGSTESSPSGFIDLMASSAPLGSPTVSFTGDNAGYIGFGLTQEVASKSGLGFAPVAGPVDGATVVWRICAATSMKTITFAVARLGRPPVLPSIDTGSPADVLLDTKILVSRPDVSVNGRLCNYVMGVYEYVVQKAIPASDPILIPNHVLGLGGLAQIDPATFSRQMVGPANPPSGFTGGPVTY